MPYCDRCARSFPHQHALEQHEAASNSHWICYDCDIDYVSYDRQREHYIQSPNHHYCRECDEDFNSEVLRLRHMHSRHWYCRVHDRAFNSDYGLQEHYRQSPDHHYCCSTLFDSYSELEEHDHEVHNYCTECGRGFQNQNNLQQHLNSKTHRPSIISCPGRGCNRSFISPSALSLHFESGTCPSGMTRAQLDRLVVQTDRNNVITNPSRLIAGPQGGYNAPTNTPSWATELSWNVSEQAYECFLCHSTFNSLVRLNQHLGSPVHAHRIYRCPNLNCRNDFGTLSALCQHVERGSCGVQRFRQVRDVMDGLTRSVRAIAF